MAGHPGDHIHRRSGGSNSEAQWRVTLRITFIGDLECQTQRRNGGSHCWRVKLRGAMAGHPGDHIHRRSGGSNSEAQWRVTLWITFIGDLECQTQRRNGGSHCWRVKLRGAMAGHTVDHIHRRSGVSNSEAQWRVTLLEGQTQRRIGGSPWGSQS